MPLHLDELKTENDFEEKDPPSRYELAKKCKDEGNVHFNENDLNRALDSYRNGIEILKVEPTKLQEHNDKHEKQAIDTKEFRMMLALRSNICLVLFKLEQYKIAIDECNKALNLDPLSLKVLFRRALAREKLSPPNLAGAASDLKLYLEHRKNSKEAIISLKRIEEKIQMYSKSSNNKENDSHNGDQIKNTTEPPIESSLDSPSNYFNSPEYQKTEVLKLLMQSTTPQLGEAYFIICSSWWEQWCLHTRIAESISKNNARLTALVNNVRRKFSPNDHDDNIDVSTSNGKKYNGYNTISSHPPPGIIDNSILLNPFHRVKPNSFQNNHQIYSLRPHLRWRYHFEVLPREIYAALRFWYGEKTNTISCRTTLHNGRVKLIFPQKLNPHPQSHPNKYTESQNPHQICFTCHSLASYQCARCASVYYCSQDCQVSHWPYHKQSCSQSARSKMHSKFIKHKAKWKRCGLNNLGNTCFLNSALQCLSHVRDLSLFFLTNQYIRDLNPQNPLGAGGYLAKSFDKVVKDLFFGSYSSVSPTTLKRAIALYAPRFAGCHQHDAQEFLAYLLDGLHEDLNRIKEKKYVEMPDVDGKRMDMQIAGAEAWDAYKRRNDSLVLDTFYGQFKSTCICPQCNKVSVAFDSFNHISLEIPQNHTTLKIIPVIVFQSNSTTRRHTFPIRYGVAVNKRGFISDLKIQLEKVCGINKSRLTICDVYENSVYDVIQDKKPIYKISANDVLVAYEVDPPTHTSIHVIATHFIPVENFDVRKHEWRIEKFGYPLIANFDSSLSCKKIWDYLWNQVSCHFLSHMPTRYIDDWKKMLNIHVVDQNGNPKEVFSDTPHQGSSILPRNSSIPLLSFLGDDSIENFVFLMFEWVVPPPLLNNNSDMFMFDKSVFEKVYNHPSVTQKQPHNNTISLDQCFSTFTKPERLDENNKWYCSSCQEHVRAMKTIQLWYLPEVLIVHLKRFENKHTRMKLETLVDFPLENLDMNRFCVGGTYHRNEKSNDSDSFVIDCIPSNYDLFAVINHYGEMGFGHYTAYAREWNDEGSLESTWNVYDDSNVCNIRAEMVTTPAAYVLFYTRVTTRN